MQVILQVIIKIWTCTNKGVHCDNCSHTGVSNRDLHWNSSITQVTSGSLLSVCNSILAAHERSQTKPDKLQFRFFPHCLVLLSPQNLKRQIVFFWNCKNRAHSPTKSGQITEPIKGVNAQLCEQIKDTCIKFPSINTVALWWWDAKSLQAPFFPPLYSCRMFYVCLHFIDVPLFNVLLLATVFK